MKHRFINIGNKDEALEFLEDFKNNNYSPFYVRVTNSHICELNEVIGKKVFRKDAVYISSLTLWEIMQPIGGIGSHHYHGLTPEDVYKALSRLQYSKDVTISGDNRYIVITDVEVSTNVYLIIVIKASAYLLKLDLKKVVVIITVYPKDK